MNNFYFQLVTDKKLNMTKVFYLSEVSVTNYFNHHETDEKELKSCYVGSSKSKAQLKAQK